MNKSIGNLFSNTRFESHEEIEPPFIWLHRGPGGHAPYGEYDYPEGYTNNRKSAEYLDAVAGDTARFRDDYNKGVEKSIDFFEKIQADFKQRGLKDKTLFIYTSDHGEILGEYGYLGHNHLACPELVRVPTTFIHPEITSGYDDRLLHNVDMVPIISDLLDIDNPRIEGFNSLERQRRVGYNHFENMFYTSGLDRLERVVKSVWDDSGGMVKIEGNRLQTTAIFAGLLLKSAHGKQIRSSGNIKNAYKRFVNNLKYENPDFSELKMEKVINQSNSGPRATSERRELSSDEIEHLKDLGYV